MENNIPEQYTGKTVDYYKSVDFNSRSQADDFFAEAKHKLMDVNNWHRITQGPSAEFCVMDARGRQQQRTIEKHDRIRIDIPGPGLPSSKGYDWVQVEDITEEETPHLKKIVVMLRPCSDPTHAGADTAHFFKNLATSTILIEQKMNNVYLHYAGRNEIVNTDNESNLDNIRNFLVGLGAKLGASYPQWKALIEGLGHPKK